MPAHSRRAAALGSAKAARIAARRAVDDPAKLQRAARIIRAALARQALTLDDLTPLPEEEDELR